MLEGAFNRYDFYAIEKLCEGSLQALMLILLCGRSDRDGARCRYTQLLHASCQMTIMNESIQRKKIDTEEAYSTCPASQIWGINRECKNSHSLKSFVFVSTPEASTGFVWSIAFSLLSSDNGAAALTMARRGWIEMYVHNLFTADTSSHFQGLRLHASCIE